ncbi:hypothetical protein CYMTET_21261 [Cymbomonas tetramitiformis]|uniref:Uncharacterized protein n=1 Tax=Cymbomonas tetramitiformis TaxID=36881 RepID=A0AAE0G2I8_9CHLO|nr:hypothetical protein CYMTET_21261 [Cymbomonas tetramitiformis]
MGEVKEGGGLGGGGGEKVGVAVGAGGGEASSGEVERWAWWGEEEEGGGGGGGRGGERRLGGEVVEVVEVVEVGWRWGDGGGGWGGGGGGGEVVVTAVGGGGGGDGGGGGGGGGGGVEVRGEGGGEVMEAEMEEMVVVVVVVAEELKAPAAWGMVSRRALESLLGLLAFCSHVVWDLSLYTRLQPPGSHRGQENGAATASDASGTLGVGGVWEQLFFMLSWADLARLPQRPWFPRMADCPSSWSINYLELFAVWWAVVLWRQRMSGHTVVVNIDNQSAMYQVGSWWGLVAYLPLLRQIFFVCSRLQPKYITTKDNLLADLLSRLDMPRFLVEHKAFLRADVWRQDRDGWMVCPVRCAALDQEFGPFTVDLCVAESRANSYCRWPTLCMFITYGSWFVQPSTIKNYLARVRQLHLQRGHEWVSVAARHAVAATMQGAKRCWGRPPRPVMPLTMADLARMALLISVHDLGQEALWAAILVGFFGLFRKDNLTTGKAGAWDTRGALVRDDVLFHEDGSVV